MQKNKNPQKDDCITPSFVENQYTQVQKTLEPKYKSNRVSALSNGNDDENDISIENKSLKIPKNIFSTQTPKGHQKLKSLNLGTIVIKNNKQKVQNDTFGQYEWNSAMNNKSRRASNI